MKLYIWESDGISAAYHDDGLLVVLAESPEQARALVRAKVEQGEADVRAWQAEWRPVAEAAGYIIGTSSFAGFWRSPEAAPFRGNTPWGGSSYFDGSDEALDREPDRIVDLDTPTWVAFNGGGYD